ncbi:VCBS repeat-containing protein [Maribacter aestuarii]|uniref:VCBS repeat-containing protein n=1 Tax=Maribacter aestuarii TaxID=1130723 RepID=UPI0025A64362|nr:VCBS repeat-containing protein [Maribacter aestuarii]
MLQKEKIYLLALLILSNFFFFSCSERDATLFEKKSKKETGITFANNLDLDGDLVVLDFEYMYNGAGVAVADFDNDGLQDIYFTGNMVSNKLYRNLGNWEFKDITQSSRTGSANWSNGVAVVDINQDGKKDIYVSRGGPRGSSSQARKNLLFINQGVIDGQLIFEEKAESWGLADDSYSVQANFFDYDRDGDLDLYLLSNALVDFNRNTSRPKDRSGKAPSMDKLFRNNGDETFTDISKEAGILIEGFGLGVEICDMNTDGWPDIYVSNDFLTDDLLYINQKDGTFQNQIADYFKHLTFNGMGNDIQDINNDGLMDVVVLDMLPPDNKRWKLTMMGNNYDEFQSGLANGYQPQYIRNTLQINNGNGSFSEVGQLSGISATEWSWSALLADFDHDGLKDLCITNGYRQDITNLDFMVYGNQALTMGTEEANKKERLAALNKLEGIKKTNYFFKNKGNLQFKDISKEAGFTEPTYSNGMAYGDLDNDGDLDLVVNNIDDPAGLFENTTKLNDTNHYLRVKFQGDKPNREGIGSEVVIYYNGVSQKQYLTPFRGYLSTVESSLHFGLGTETIIDSLKVRWPDGRIQELYDLETNKEIVLKQEESIEKAIKITYNADSVPLFFQTDSLGIDFKHEEDDFVDYRVQALLPHMHSRNGPGISVADVNGDKREDFYIGGAAGQEGALFIQNSAGSFDQQILKDFKSEDMGSLFFDADNDGDQDLYVVSGGSSFGVNHQYYQDRLYENDGKGNFSKIEGALPTNFVSGSVVSACDYDKDGDLDLFVGGRVRPGEYPLQTKNVLLQNNSASGELVFIEDPQHVQSIFSELGMVTSALWTDYDNDTWQDLIVVGEFMPVRIFHNIKGELREVTEETGLNHTSGWWNSISGGDFDNDGDTDYILGNLGLNSRYRTSPQEPLCIYAKDYDKNGQIDPVMCYYVDGKNYIAHSRNDLIDQINAMRGRFKTYSDYANATFEESFLKDEISDAYILKSETFESSYLQNLGGGKFALTPLPLFAQTAPIYGTLVGDYTKDGNLDILAVGNFYSGEVFAGRYDASIGWLMIGDGKGNFTNSDVRESGFYIQEDAKGLANLITSGKELIITGVNDGMLKTHTFLRPDNNVYRPMPYDIYAVITLENDKKQKIEFHYGSGYLSSSSRSLLIPSTAKSVIIGDSSGNETEILAVK